MTQPDPDLPAWHRLSEQLNYFRLAAQKQKNRHMLNRSTAILVSGIVIVLGAAAPFASTEARPVLAFATVVAGAALAATEGFRGLKKYEENWLRNRQAAEGLKRERALFLASAPPYHTPEAPQLLALRVEAIVAGDVAAWATAFRDGQTR